MSNIALNYVWSQSKMSGPALLLMVAIADMANDDGECYPGKANLAKKLRTTPRNVLKLIKKCEAAGELLVESGAGIKTAHGHTNRYIIAGLAHRDVKARGGVSKPTRDVQTDTPGVSKSTPLGVSKSTPKPSVEPSVETNTTPPTGEVAHAIEKPLPRIASTDEIIALANELGKLTMTDVAKRFGPKSGQMLQAMVNVGQLVDMGDCYMTPPQAEARRANGKGESAAARYIKSQTAADERPDWMRTADPALLPMINAVIEHFGVFGWSARWIAEILTGKAVRKGWVEYNIRPALVASDVPGFVEYVRREVFGGKKLTMIREPQKIHDHVLAWRNEAEQARTRQQNAEPMITMADMLAEG